MATKPKPAPKPSPRQSYTPATIRITQANEPLLNPWLAQGGSAYAVGQLIQWAQAALGAGRGEVAGLFTAQEWNFLDAVLDGTLIEPSIMPHLASEVAEAVKYLEENSELPAGVAAWRAVERLRGLGSGGRWAVCDALLRYRALEWEARDGRMRTWIGCGVVPGEGI